MLRDKEAYVKSRLDDRGVWPLIYKRQVRALATYLRSDEDIEDVLAGRWKKREGATAKERSFMATLLEGQHVGLVALTKNNLLVVPSDHVERVPVDQVTGARCMSGSLTIKIKEQQPLTVNGITPSGAGAEFAATIRGRIGASVDYDRREMPNALYVETRLADLGVDTSKLRMEMHALAGYLRRYENIEVAARCSWTRLFAKRDRSNPFGQRHDMKNGYVAVTKERIILAAKDGVIRTPVSNIDSVLYRGGIASRDGASLDIRCKSGPSFGIRKIKTDEARAALGEAINARIAANKDAAPAPGIDSHDGSETVGDYIALRLFDLGTPTNGIEGECKMLAKRLDKGEKIMHAVKGAFAPDMKQFTASFGQMMHNGIAVLTDKRILFLDKSWFGSEEVAEIPIARVESVSTSRGIALGGLHINCVGTSSYKIEMVDPPHAAEEFANAVRKEVENRAFQTPQPAQAAPAPQASVADELIKLKGLLDAGAIDEAEFDALKATLIPG